jgi:hypothetical protein
MSSMSPCNVIKLVPMRRGPGGWVRARSASCAPVPVPEPVPVSVHASAHTCSCPYTTCARVGARVLPWTQPRSARAAARAAAVLGAMAGAAPVRPARWLMCRHGARCVQSQDSDDWDQQAACLTLADSDRLILCIFARQINHTLKSRLFARIPHAHVLPTLRPAGRRAKPRPRHAPSEP